MKDTSLSLHKIESMFSRLIPFGKQTILKDIPSFTIKDMLNPKYITPLFSKMFSNSDSIESSKVILISAAGATGKSELTNYLSAKHQMPIFNLANHNPVAANSLTGLFFDTLGHVQLGDFVSKLKNGENFIIIDALDEGYIKTTIPGFNAFLDEVVNLSKDSISISFILLGRTQVMEHTALYLDDKKVDLSLLRIEPFTVEQAREFIDKQINEKKFDEQFKLVRDYIINSVEGFFRNQSEINKKQYTSFIGYAPVLLSITKLLKQTQNYKALYEKLQGKEDKGVDLIVSIVEYILQRDKVEKIDKLVLPVLTEGRSQEFRDDINNRAYLIEEQCIRLLSLQMGKEFSQDISKDERFNIQYEEKLDEWIKEHPFLDDGSIQNAVFESYIIAKLMSSGLHNDIVFEYLNTKYKDAFMLFFIFEKLSANKQIPSVFLPYLYSSLKSLDDKKIHSSMIVEEAICMDCSVECDIEFSVNDEETYSFAMELQNNSELRLLGCLSNVSINAPIGILLNSRRCELSSPVSINCKRMRISVDEIVVEKGINGSSGVLIECEKLEIDYNRGIIPSLMIHLDNDQEFAIISDILPEHPFTGYHRQCEAIEDPLLREKYMKLRKIIVLFRSHSKGRMARFKDKIENKRVSGGIGKNVLDELIDTGVLYLEDKFYFIDPDKIHSELGVSYNEIRLRKTTNKTIDFLRQISN